MSDFHVHKTILLVLFFNLFFNFSIYIYFIFDYLILQNIISDGLQLKRVFHVQISRRERVGIAGLLVGNSCAWFIYALNSREDCSEILALSLRVNTTLHLEFCACVCLPLLFIYLLIFIITRGNPTKLTTYLSTWTCWAWVPKAPINTLGCHLLPIAVIWRCQF